MKKLFLAGVAALSMLSATEAHADLSERSASGGLRVQHRLRAQ